MTYHFRHWEALRMDGRRKIDDMAPTVCCAENECKSPGAWDLVEEDVANRVTKHTPYCSEHFYQETQAPVA